MRRCATPLLALVQSYFQVHLRRVRGASEHTIRAYRDGLRLFFVFASQKLGRSIADLRLDDLRPDLVLAFLDHLEAARRNGAVTRNCRRAPSCCRPSPVFPRSWCSTGCAVTTGASGRRT